MIRSLAACALAVLISGCSEAADPAQDRAEIETIVREYIIANPELIEDALVELRRRAEARETQQLRDAAVALTGALFDDARDPFIGAAGAVVTVVEFTDYACAFCKRAHEWKELMLTLYPGQVRFVHKTLPLRGEASEISALAALSVWEGQRDVYEAFHDGLMLHRGALDQAALDEVAEAAGVDVAAMRAGMLSPEVEAHLDRTFELANRLSLRGTPMFLFPGDVIIPGYAAPEMTAALEAALAAAGDEPADG
ncbi:DsbA family protein [Hyphomonadaceae bacterium ML37]|nr:DsbA family protein [Hyphomonadaceae bacterium ML37]